MKILFVVKNMRISNGVSSYVMNYYRQLQGKDNLKFDFLIVSDVGSRYYEEIKANGSRIYFLPSLKKPFKVIKFLKELFKNNKYDILHSNVFNSDAIIAIIAKKYGVPVRILHSHATSNGDGIIKKIRNKPFQFLSIKYSNYYFACSNLAGKNIFGNKKFYVINNAIDLEKYKFNNETRNKIRKEEEIPKNRLVIGTVGRITEQKNPYFILDIIDNLKKRDFDFAFWWFGSGNLDNEITQKAKEMKVDDKIKFYGSISNVMDYYSAMDIFILPSLYEGLPVVGIEAQANYIRCLFSNTITEEAKKSSYCEFLPISNASDWADSIIEAKNISRDEIGQQTYLDDYNIKKLSKNLLNIYEELLSENNVKNGVE